MKMPEFTPPKLVLYHRSFCSYCGRVINAIHQLGAEVEGKNTWQDSEALMELEGATGRSTVPVLRIESANGEVRWMPESNDIITYLNGLAR